MTTKLALHLQETTPLTGLDRATLVVMANRADENGELQTTSTDLATELDCEPSEVRRSVKRLILSGCVSRHGDWFLVHGDDSVLTESETSVNSSEASTVSTVGTEIEPTAPATRTENEERSEEPTPQGPVPTVKPKTLTESQKVFAALCAVGGHDEKNLSRQELGIVKDCLKQVLDLGCTADDVLQRAKRWGEAYTGAELTITALLRHWSRLAPDSGIKGIQEGVEAAPFIGGSRAAPDDTMADHFNVNPNPYGKYDKPVPRCSHGFAYNLSGVSTCYNDAGEFCIRPGFEKEAREWLRIQ